MNILIVGAGIGGLACALALSRLGAKVTLVEKRKRLEPVGAGLTLAPNACAALEWLGVPLAACAQPVASFSLLSRQGQVYSQISAEMLPAGGMWACSRSALSNALERALPSSVALHLGSTLSSWQNGDSGVDLQWDADARPEARAIKRVDLVIGADGLRSQIRDQGVEPVPLRYSGVTCYRGLMPNPGIVGASETWGGRDRIGLIPVEDQKLYYFLVTRAAQGDEGIPTLEAIRQRFAGFSVPDIGRFLAALDHVPPLHHDLLELSRIVWGRQRIFLVGDAAHAMTPNQGQGAAMAIEDALALAQAIKPGLDGGLLRYCALRQDRVERVKSDSRRIGEIAHLEHGVLQWLRDLAFRLVPQRVALKSLHSLVQPCFELLRALDNPAT